MGAIIVSISVLLVVAAVVFFVVFGMIRDKRRGKSSCSCGCGCEGCAMSASCASRNNSEK